MSRLLTAVRPNLPHGRGERRSPRSRFRSASAGPQPRAAARRRPLPVARRPRPSARRGLRRGVRRRSRVRCSSTCVSATATPILELLATEQVNTNEVGRSALIGPALTAVASRWRTSRSRRRRMQRWAQLALRSLSPRLRPRWRDGSRRRSGGRSDATSWWDHPRSRRASRRSRHASGSTANRSTSSIHGRRGGSWPARGPTPDGSRGPGSRSRRRVVAQLELVRGDAVDDVGGLIAALPPEATAVVTTTWVVVLLLARTADRLPPGTGSRQPPSPGRWHGSAPTFAASLNRSPSTVSRRTETASNGACSAS